MSYMLLKRLRKIEEARNGVGLAVGLWRCAKCNVPVMPDRNQPCKCIPGHKS